MLRQVAALFDPYRQDGAGPAAPFGEATGDPEAHIFVQRLSAAPDTRLRTGSQPTLALPPGLPPGFQTARIGTEPYRVWVRVLPDGDRLAVAQETAVRDEIARNSALRTVMPFLALVPILLLLVGELVRRIFRPVSELAGVIDQRSEQDLQPVAVEHLPAEIRPFVGAINRLLERVGQSMEIQRRFVADAAHELRTPLTALSLQAERLAGAEMSEVARARLEALRQGIERGRALALQLLAMARAQGSAAPAGTPVAVGAVFRRVLEDLLPLAEAKGIDLGVLEGPEARVLAPEVDLFTLVRNLVDNAIRYTPAGGRVDLWVQAGHGRVTLEVKDNGPGIPEAERERVFDPFYRVLGSDQAGSGLGLAIVQAIAARLGGTISLAHADERAGTGLRVRVTLPQGPADPSRPNRDKTAGSI